MRQFLRFNAACIVLAVVAHAGTHESLVTLDPLANPAHPAFTVLGESEGSLRLEMRVSALGREELPIEGERFQALTIPGGDIRGETGQPGLPVITRLVAVPSDVSVVEAGAPALMHSLRVVPLTFAPVAYDPVSGE
ncbi:MAG: hypothetical protein MUE60_09010, partial [Candidatus Eisenbacteria bacterium]|nr:hypothetical protein [Candidatus Eisenbacteria bacterium]